jgi:glycosyltransferase involved in cell wall biosynthesis
MGEVHLFEPSGYAGVFQHACRVAQLLQRHEQRVVLHTGHHYEKVELDGVEVCPCTWWPRDQRRGPSRSTRIAARFVLQTLPHLRHATRRGVVLHVQGIAAAGGLTLLTLVAGRLGRRRVVYSPHDTFSRRGPIDSLLLRVALRVPHAVLVHSQADAEVLRAAHIPALYAPLVQLVPAPTEISRRRWRSEWRAGEATDVVLFAGCIRPEKRLDLLIESARSWPPGRKLAVVGEDRGAWEDCALLGKRHGVDIAARVEFVDLDDFTAALAAADVVVAPHAKATQSGVLSLARQLGVPTVAARVGGLGELASRTFAAGDADALSRAIDAELQRSEPAERTFDEELALEAHLRAYGHSDGAPHDLTVG